MAVPPEIAKSLTKPAALYVVLSDESMLVREVIAALREATVAGPMAAFNHAQFTGGEEAALGFVDACRQVAVMAPMRLVEIGQIQDANAGLLEALLQYVAAPVQGTVLLVTGAKMPAASGGVDRGLRIVNAAKKTGIVCKIDSSDIDPLSLARSRAAPYGATIDAQAVQKLRELGGNDIDTLVANVERCAGFVGEGKAITVAVVEEMVVSTAEADVWKLTDAIVDGDKNTALCELHRLLEDGEAPHRLLASVAYQLRQILLVQDAMMRKLPERESGVKMPPFKLTAVRKACERRKFSPSFWLEEVAVANQRMNSSRAGDRRIFEALVLRLVVP
jgi:DNA polymerase-3 subunit delta